MYAILFVLISLFTVFYASACFVVFFFKQKTAYEMRITDWSSDVCSSDLSLLRGGCWLRLRVRALRLEMERWCFRLREEMKRARVFPILLTVLMEGRPGKPVILLLKRYVFLQLSAPWCSLTTAL